MIALKHQRYGPLADLERVSVDFDHDEPLVKFDVLSKLETI